MTRKKSEPEVEEVPDLEGFGDTGIAVALLALRERLPTILQVAHQLHKDGFDPSRDIEDDDDDDDDDDDTDERPDDTGSRLLGEFFRAMGSHIDPPRPRDRPRRSRR